MAQKRMSLMGRKSEKGTSKGSGVAPTEEGDGGSGGDDEGRLIRQD